MCVSVAIGVSTQPAPSARRRVPTYPFPRYGGAAVAAAACVVDSTQPEVAVEAVDRTGATFVVVPASAGDASARAVSVHSAVPVARARWPGRVGRVAIVTAFQRRDSVTAARDAWG